MASPRKKDSERFRIYTSQRSGFEFGFQPQTSRPNAYWREAGKPVQDVNIQVAPNEFDSPPPSTQPLGGKDISGSARANSDFATASNAFIYPPQSQDNISYVFSSGIDLNTVLMLHMDGANGSTTFTDSEINAPKVVTANGSAQISDTQFKFNESSGAFDGINSFLTLTDNNDFDFSGGVWTIDFWAFFSSVAPNKSLFSQRTDSQNYILCDVINSGTLEFTIVDNDDTAVSLFSNAGAITTNTWYHIAVVESGNNYYLFLNGVLVRSTSNAKRAKNYTGTFQIGAFNGSSLMNGYMDEFRISKGTARWTSAFTPPTSAYSSATSTIAISSFSPTFISGFGAAVKMDATPQLSYGRQSQIVTLECVGSGVTLINGSGLSLRTNEYVMSSGSLINLIYETSNTTWLETSRGQLFGDLGQF